MFNITNLMNRFSIVATYLFGSRARGDARPDSDVDVLLTSDIVIDRRGKTAIAADIDAELIAILGWDNIGSETAGGISPGNGCLWQYASQITGYPIEKLDLFIQYRIRHDAGVTISYSRLVWGEQHGCLAGWLTRMPAEAVCLERMVKRFRKRRDDA